MFIRISLILFSILLVISTGIIAIYYINPYDLKTDNIRPRVFGFDIYQIPSKSMQPLLFPGDYIMVSSLAYTEDLPKRNDVIIFDRSNQKSPSSKTLFIKRILAISGDNIQIQNGKLFVNKEFVDESYVSKNNNKAPYSTTMKLTYVPQNHVYVMGDNRDNSLDSRMYGMISNDAIIAKATKILYGKNNRSGKKIK